MTRYTAPPPLAFGQRIARTSRSADELASMVSGIRGWEARYEPIGPASEFVTHSAILNVNGLKVAAISHSPKATHVVAHDSSMMVFTTAGMSYASTINGRPVNFEQGRSAAYATEGLRVGRGDYRSVLMIDVDRPRLLNTLAAMRGDHDPLSTGLDLDIPEELALRSGSLAMDAGLHHLCGLLDLYCTTPAALAAMAIDESFYRLMAMLFRPEWVSGTETRDDRRSITPDRLDAACQYAIAHLHEAVSLTDLERVANLSSRSLQYAFRQEYGCSPMQWLRSQRLQLAHRRLKAAQPGDSVTAIALSCGLPHLSHFSADYRRIFGESPSETLARALRR